MKKINRVVLLIIAFSFLIYHPQNAISLLLRPQEFSLRVNSEHFDNFPQPRVQFTVTWNVPDGKRVAVREVLPDGSVNIYDAVYPPLVRSWGTQTGTWTYLAYVQESGQTTYLSNTAQVIVPSPLQPSLLFEDFEDNNFWTPQYSVGWWDSSSAYQRSYTNTIVYSGLSAMQVNYNKLEEPWAVFSAYLDPNNYRKQKFNDYNLLTVWAYGEADILLKLRDTSGQEQDVMVQWVNSTDGWKKLYFDYSTISTVDLDNIKDVLFFVKPGDAHSSGTIYLDEIRLERTRPVLIEDFQDDNFWTPGETVGWWDSSGTGVYQRARIYQKLSAVSDDRPMMSVTYNKSGDPWSLFGAYIATTNPLRDFSRHTKLTVWVKSPSGDTQILAKLRDRQQQEEDISIQTAGPGWSKLEFDYSYLTTVDLSDIENILFFIAPGNSSLSGMVLLYDISLE